MLVSCLEYSTLKMEAIYSSETSISFQRTTPPIKLFITTVRKPQILSILTWLLSLEPALDAIQTKFRSPDSSVSIATGWTARVRFKARAKEFTLLHNIQADPEVHPVSYPMGIGGFCTGSKASGAWRWSLNCTQCRGQEWWSYTSTPHTSSLRST
jgi:hypothetical protein